MEENKVMIRLSHGYYVGGGKTFTEYLPDDRHAYCVLARFDRRKTEWRGIQNAR